MPLKNWWPVAWARGEYERSNASSLDPFLQIYGQRVAKTGQTINLQTAFRVATVLACGRVISEDMAQLPVRLYRDDGGRRLAVADHALSALLLTGPNSWQTTFEFVEQMVLHAAFCGNAYALIMRGVNGQVVELLPVLPSWVAVKREKDWTVSYEVRLPSSDGRTEVLQVAKGGMMHLRGPSWDGVAGLDVLDMAREAIGLSMAAEEAHAMLHKNGLSPSGIYSVDGQLNDVQHKRLSAVLEEYQGSGKSSRPLILDRAAKWVAQSMSGVDAQHLETRRYQVEEISRAFRVMPIMIGYSDKAATYASSEQMFLQHVVHTLAPWAKRFESVFARDLLSTKDVRAGYYLKFALQALMRGDSVARSNFYQKGILSGWMTRNEARELEEMNPIDGLDEPLTPANVFVGADGNTGTANG